MSMYQGERVCIYLLWSIFWLCKSIKLVYSMGFTSDFLGVQIIFEALALLLLVECKERRWWRLDINFNGVSWRVLMKFSLTWLTGLNGLLLLRFFLNAPPFVFRLVRFPLKFISSLAGWWIYGRVEALEWKIEKMVGTFLKKKEHKGILDVDLVKSFQGQQISRLSVCFMLSYVYVTLRVFVKEVRLPPYI